MQKGFTILAEARILDQGCPAGRWRLRLIGSSPSLIAPKASKTEISSVFNTKELRDYYVPNENKIILRHKVIVAEDHLASLQLTVSKPDVYIKFTIYDNNEEVFTTTGKGVAVIPAFIFIKDRSENSADNTLSNTSRPGSKTCNFSINYNFI